MALFVIFYLFKEKCENSFKYFVIILYFRLIGNMLVLKRKNKSEKKIIIII